jgi:calcineurin-like phosphoesterase family protein
MISILYDTFKKWSAKGSVYIISDPHFSDTESFEFRKASGKLPEEINSVEDLDHYIIESINKIVHKNDCLLVLGDVGNKDCVKKLKAGYKVLLLGNHDKGTGYYKDVFDEVYSGPLMISDKVILSHEPIIPCPDYLVNLCGHVHAKEHEFAVDKHKYYNFCAEAIDYRPVSLGNLIKNGLLSKVKDIHRVTVDGAIIRKKHRAGK